MSSTTTPALGSAASQPTKSRREKTREKKKEYRERERERKDLDALGRRHYLNVRVVQRNVVYVVGLGARFAKEEVGIKYIALDT